MIRPFNINDKKKKKSADAGQWILGPIQSTPRVLSQPLFHFSTQFSNSSYKIILYYFVAFSLIPATVLMPLPFNSDKPEVDAAKYEL